MQEIATRAEEDEETDLISFDSGYGDIYIHAFAEGADGSFKTDGTYIVKEGGTAGILVARNQETDRLEWWNTKANHYFHAWNVPETVVTMEDDMKTGQVSFLSHTEPADEIDGYTGIHKKNNIALEKFIATQTGPVNYRTNGSYVKLHFRHLVSKITVTGIERIGTNGGTEYLSNAKITFPDMPQTGTFHTGIAGDDHMSKPYVETNDNVHKGLSFNALSSINNNNQSLYYSFYLPPFKFDNNGEFIVEGRIWTGTNFEECGPYYGHLKDIEAVKELKAGEHMELRLRVKDGQVFGTVITIHGWTTAPSYDSGHSPKHKGIYSIDDLVRFYEFCKSGSTDFSQIEDLFETDKDGNKVIRLYNDIDIPNSGFGGWMGWLDRLPGDDFIFDGMGHNITSLVNGDGQSIDFFVGGLNIRDLWLDGKKYGS